MELYHAIGKKNAVKTLAVLNEFAEKFPQLKASDIDFDALAKHYQLSGKDFISMLALMDAFKTFNENAKMTGKRQSAFIDLNDIKVIKIRREADQWIFEASGVKKKNNLTLQHNYQAR